VVTSRNRPPINIFYIDALNVAYWFGAPPILRIPLSLLSGLLAAGYKAQLVFDASAPHQLADSNPIYSELLKHSAYCLQVPSGHSADSYLLQQARQHNGCIISRDRFKEYHKQYRSIIHRPERLISGFVDNDQIILPTVDFSALLSSSDSAAWEQLRNTMNR